MYLCTYVTRGSVFGKVLPEAIFVRTHLPRVQGLMADLILKQDTNAKQRTSCMSSLYLVSTDSFTFV
jgi:hypothetical protein